MPNEGTVIPAWLDDATLLYFDPLYFDPLTLLLV